MPALIDCGEEWVNSLARRAYGLHDGRNPVFARRVVRCAERLHRANLLLHSIGAIAVSFVDGEDVGDLHNARLEALHIVSHSRDKHDDSDIGQADDLDFILSDANGFDKENISSAGFDHLRYVACGCGKTTQRPARGHAANIEAVVTCMLLHADTVAEKRAAGKRTGWIDGYHANSLARCSPRTGQAVDERALAGSRRACDAYTQRATRMRKTCREHVDRLRRAVFDNGDCTGERSGISITQMRDQFGNSRHRSRV